MKPFIAVTGGIASGKSAVTDAFAALGVDIADADLIAREVVAPGSEALIEIRQRFGDAVFDTQGGLQRAALRQLVFSDADAKRDLEAITHPRIALRMREVAARADSPYSIASVPLWIETAASSRYDWVQRLLVVHAPRQLRLSRLLQRDGIDLELAERMLRQQASDAQRLAVADDWLINDGTLSALQQAVQRLHQRYLALS